VNLEAFSAQAFADNLVDFPVIGLAVDISRASRLVARFSFGRRRAVQPLIVSAPCFSLLASTCEMQSMRPLLAVGGFSTATESPDTLRVWAAQAELGRACVP